MAQKRKTGKASVAGVAKPSKAAKSLTQGIAPDLARILRPQAAYRWMLPQLAAITPQYIEMTLRGALAGNHMQQWELFSLMVDSWPRLLKNQMELTNGVCNLQKTYTAYQEEDEPATDSAEEKKRLVSAALRQMKPAAANDENALNDTVHDIMDAWFKGVSVLEVDWQFFQHAKLGQVIGPRCTFWVHPTCYCFSMAGYLGLRTDAAGKLSPGLISTPSYQPMPASVAPFPENKFLIAIRKATSGTALGGALLRPLAWWWCAANFSADWLLNLAQTFGLPFRWANYPTNAPQTTIDAICNMLQNMGSNAWAAFPEGTTLDLKEAAAKGEHTPQGDMLDRADKQCDLLLLGQTLTSDAGRSGKGGGSLALGKVHEGVKGDIITAAADFVIDVLENQLFTAILQLNYGEATEVPGLTLQSEKEEDLAAKATMLAAFPSQALHLIPQDWFNKTFEIPVPQHDQKTLGDLLPSAPAATKPPGGGEGGATQDPESGEATGKAATIQAKLQEIAAIKDDDDFATALEALSKS